MTLTILGAADSLRSKQSMKLTKIFEVTRVDGQVMRFTEHDQQIVFDGNVYSPDAWADSSAIRSEKGLRVSDLEIQGVIDSSAVTAEDLHLGLYDGASIVVRVVDWGSPFAGAVMEFPYWVDSVEYDGERFVATIEGLGRWFQVKKNRIHGRTCPHDLFDSRCGLSDTGFKFVDCSVQSVPAGSGRTSFVIDGGSGTPTITGALGADYFTEGEIRWTTGDNAGTKSEIRQHDDDASGFYPINLYLPTGKTIQVGDQFTIFAGDDKLAATCKAKFNNLEDGFGGDPFMPGTDRRMQGPG